jgi:DNA mismatch repair protein MutS2
VPDSSGQFEVQLGSLRTRVSVEQVERSEPASARPEPQPATTAPPPPAAAPDEVEVRGQTIDEAMPVIERFLDQAARSGHARALVIHGRGTGTLRRAVQELLGRHPLVTSFETAEPREGGEGVTVAHLAGTR